MTADDSPQQLLSEIAALRVGPNDRLVIRVDPSVELEAQGFHDALAQVLADAGLSGRAVVISLPVTKVDFALFEGETDLRDHIQGP